jgi:hypothetical protein
MDHRFHDRACGAHEKSRRGLWHRKSASPDLRV